MKLKTLAAVALVIVFALMAVEPAAAADRLKYEDYLTQLKVFQDRETAARDQIAKLRAEIDDLRAQIRELEGRIAALWDEIYAAAGTTREDVEALGKRISDLEARVAGLAKLSPDQLLDRANELDELAAMVQALLGEKPAKLTELRNRLLALADRIAALKASLPKPKYDLYTVVRGDYLWKISGKKEIYGDPWKWMRIYSVNRSEINNPDLIYPRQVLRVPRQIGRDEYLVTRGQSLRQIAALAEVYGDPFQWTKIYQANKTGGFIQDPNLIYPEMILTIPRD